MPLLNDEELTPRGYIYQSPSRNEIEAAKNKPTAGETLKAAFRQENSIGSLLSHGLQTNSASDPEYDPFEKIQGYEDYAYSFVEANSDEDVARIKNRIDSELKDKQTLQDAGVLGFASAMAAGVLDPINLVPIGGTGYKAYKVGKTGTQLMKGAVKTAVAGGVGNTLQEIPLQMTQEVRTFEESTMSIGGGVVLGGILGGAASMIGSLKTLKVRNLEQLNANINKSFDELDGVVPQHSTAGAKFARETTLEDEQLVDALGIEKAIKFQDPVLRTANSANLQTRLVAEGLVDQNLLKNKNLKGIATDISVESRIKLWNANLYQGLKKLDDSFVKYRLGMLPKFGDVTKIAIHDTLKETGKMNRRQFLSEVSVAMRNGDTHRIKEVAEAAKNMRRTVFDPLKEEAVRLGMLPKDVSVDTAVSYLTRIYDKEKIAKNRGEFEKIIKNWLVEQSGKFETRASNPLQETNNPLTYKQGVNHDTTENISADNAQQRAIYAVRQEMESRGYDTESSGPFKRRGLEENSSDVSQFDGRGSPNGIRPRLVESVWTLADKEKEILEGAGIPAPSLFELKADNHEAAVGFYDAITSAKKTLGSKGDSVYTYSAEEYRQMKLFLSGDALSGVAIKPDGDIVSVFSASAEKHRSVSLLLAALQNGGKKLDCFDTFLPKIYSYFGFRAVSRNKWADDFAPENWNKSYYKAFNNGEPDVVYMVYDKYHYAPYQPKDGKLFFGADAYDNAVKTQSHYLQTPRDKLSLDQQSVAEMESEAKDITDKILGLAEDGRLNYDGVQIARGPMKERTFSIPDDLIADYLEKDIEEIARRYLRTMAPDIELTAKFGKVDLKAQIEAIGDEYNKMVSAVEKRRDQGKISAAQAEKELGKIEKDRGKDVKDIEAMRDRMRGTYAIPDDPESFFYRGGRVLRGWNYITRLGGMTISAFTDLGGLVFTHGFSRSLKDGLLPMIKNFKTYRLAAEEVKMAGTALDMILDSRGMAMADVFYKYGKGSKVERATQYMGNKMSLLSLMSPWNATLKQLAGTITQSRVLKACADWDKEIIAAKEKANLAKLGIDEPMALRINQQFKQFGEIKDGVYLARTDKWNDFEVSDIYKASLNKEVDRIIVTPGQDKPLFMSKDLGAMVMQFKSFGIASMQRTMLAGLQRKDSEALQGAILMIGLGMMVHYLKTPSERLSDNPADWVVNGLDRSGLMGWFFDVNNTMEKVTGGRIGLSSITNEQAGRYQSRNVTGSLLGPSFGIGEDVIKLFGSTVTADWKESDTKALRRMVPFQNIFYMRWLFDQMEAGVNNALGVETN